MDTKGYGVSLMELFRLLMKKIRVIIAVVIACVIVMEIVTPRGSTYYQCTAIMIIEPNTRITTIVTNAEGSANSLLGSDLTMEQNVENNDVNYRIETGAQLASVCSAVMKSDMILQPIVEDLGLSRTTENLANDIEVESIEDSQMMQIKVKASSGEEAKEICERLIADSKDMILKLTDAATYEEAYAPKASEKSMPSGKLKSAIMGLFLGLVLSVAGIIIQYMLDDHVRTEKDIVYGLDMRVLGVIPAETEGKKQK